MNFIKVLYIKQLQIYGLILKKDFYLLLVGLVLSISIYKAFGKAPPEPYYGRLIGSFKNYAHGIKGSVYAIDETTLFIKGFAYDGTAPDAFFWVGRTPRPSPEGTMIVYPENSDHTGLNPPILRAHKNSDIILRLPMGKRIKDIRWLSVWCRRFTVDFGEVFIPPGIDVPKPRVLPEFRRLAHGLRSSNISILDAKTFYIPNFHYDGLGPDSYFWVGNGPEPNIMGTKVSNEVGSFEPLRMYQGEDIEIQLPGNITVYDIEWLAVWSIEYRINFGHVFIPRDLDVPPALGQTKLAPPWWYNPTTTPSPPVANNCRELLKERLQVKWAAEGEYLHIELIGRIDEDQCIIFGISGANHQSDTLGADVVVAYYDKLTNTFQAQDYFISREKECDGKHGVCPDDIIGGKNDIIITKGERKNDITRIKYKRLIKTREPHLDREIPLNRKTSVVAAISQLSALNQPSFNFENEEGLVLDSTEINFSSKNDNTCSNSLQEVIDVNSPINWSKLTLVGETVINARIGPKQLFGSYMTNLAWYLNDLLLPDLVVERGETYTFIVEGGNDPSILSRYHPFYITDTAEGGAVQFMKSEFKDFNIYAGIIFDEQGYPTPLGVGKLCEFKLNNNRDVTYETFDDFVKSLSLECEPGDAGYFNWTVPMDAPDLLYYQCFVHKNHGGKIHVINSDSTNFGNKTVKIYIMFNFIIIFSFFATLKCLRFY